LIDTWQRKNRTKIAKMTDFWKKSDTKREVLEEDLYWTLFGISNAWSAMSIGSDLVLDHY
jgi:hypothetical protein